MRPQRIHRHLQGSTLIHYFVHSHQSVALLVHVLAQTDDDVLRICLRSDVLGKKRGVAVVESCVNFVHEIKRELFYLLTREDQS